MSVVHSQTAEYALRVMAQFALLPQGESARAKDLSPITGIPVHYLSKILRKLVVAGLLQSQKGHGGGFVLGRLPAQISFAEILHAVGYDFDPNQCAFGWGRCSPAHPCPLHDTWSDLNATVRNWADTNSLACIRKSEDTAVLKHWRQGLRDNEDAATAKRPGGRPANQLVSLGRRGRRATRARKTA